MFVPREGGTLYEGFPPLGRGRVGYRLGQNYRSKRASPYQPFPEPIQKNMKAQIKTPLIIGALAVFVVGILYWGVKLVGGSGNLDQGQVKYTPGKPPWLETDPSKRGPGSGPPPVAGSDAPTRSIPNGPPVIGNGIK